MEINKEIQTKYGIIDVTFYFEEGVWVANNNNSKLCVVVQEYSFNEAYDKIIELYEYIYEFNIEYESNPNKNKVNKEVLNDLIHKKMFWKLQNN